MLEEEWDASGKALVSDLLHPRGVNRAVPRSALPPDDHPVNPFQRKSGDRAEERFERQEPYCGWHLLKVRDPPSIAGILHGDPLPDVRRPD